jgi:hypothetical protein
MPVFEEHVVEGRGAAGGFGGIEGDDGAVGEAGAFAEGGGCYSTGWLVAFLVA